MKSFMIIKQTNKQTNEEKNPHKNSSTKPNQANTLHCLFKKKKHQIRCFLICCPLQKAVLGSSWDQPHPWTTQLVFYSSAKKNSF